MTNASNRPLTAEEKLADRRWRTLNSWWIVVPLVSCGFLGWVGFMVAAIRSGKRKYWIFTGVYAAVFAVFMTLAVLADGTDGLLSDLAVIPFLLAWVAPAIHAGIWNRQYLRDIATQEAWYKTGPHPPQPSRTHAAATPPDPFLGVTSNDYYAPGQPAAQPHTRPAVPLAKDPEASTAQPAAVTGPIDPNTATAEALTTIPGVSPALANRIVAIRDARDGYRDLDDLASSANLQPHELVRLREHLIFKPQTPPQQPPGGQQGTGRILDI